MFETLIILYRMRLKNLDSTSNSNIFGDNCPIFPILFLNERLIQAKINDQ